MMNIAIINEVLPTTVLFLCVWFGVFYLYRDYRVDVFRQRVFRLRDELFDEAEKGFISFDHEAYCLLRTTMNGFLRFGHKVSLFDMMIMYSITKKHLSSIDEDYSFEKRWKQVSSSVDKHTLERLEYYRGRMHRLLIDHSIKSSPLLMSLLIVFIFPMVILYFVKDGARAIFANVFKKPLDSVESAAMAYGKA